MVIDKETLEAINASVAASMSQVLKTLNIPTTPPANTPAGGASNEPPPAVGSPEFMKQIIEGVSNVIEQKEKGKNKAVFDTMFQERLAEMTSRAPAFKDFLDSTDHYGDKFADKLNAMDDYTKRIETLTNLFKTFASQSNTGGDPSNTMSKEQIAKQAQQKTKEDEIKSKWDKGELSQEEYCVQLFSTAFEGMNQQ